MQTKKELEYAKYAYNKTIELLIDKAKDEIKEAETEPDNCDEYELVWLRDWLKQYKETLEKVDA